VDAAASGFAVVEGPVRWVTEVGRRVYLDFTDRRDGFAAEIPAAAQGDLGAAGFDPLALPRSWCGCAGWSAGTG